MVDEDAAQIDKNVEETDASDAVVEIGAFVAAAIDAFVAVVTDACVAAAIDASVVEIDASVAYAVEIDALAAAAVV